MSMPYFKYGKLSHREVILLAEGEVVILTKW